MMCYCPCFRTSRGLSLFGMSLGAQPVKLISVIFEAALLVKCAQMHGLVLCATSFAAWLCATLNSMLMAPHVEPVCVQ